MAIAIINRPPHMNLLIIVEKWIMVNQIDPNSIKNIPSSHGLRAQGKKGMRAESRGIPFTGCIDL